MPTTTTPWLCIKTALTGSAVQDEVGKQAPPSHDDVYTLGEAYAFGVIWSFAFKALGQALGQPLRRLSDEGRLAVRQVNPAELSPGEFASQVVKAVEHDKCSLVIIDSINGYMQSMPEERLLAIQIHELLSFLSNNGVTCIMTLVQHGIFGNPVDEEVDDAFLRRIPFVVEFPFPAWATRPDERGANPSATARYV